MQKEKQYMLQKIREAEKINDSINLPSCGELSYYLTTSKRQEIDSKVKKLSSKARIKFYFEETKTLSYK